jgi:V/A-type H+-transporting ATPase subunit I
VGYLQTALEDVEESLSRLGAPPEVLAQPGQATTLELAFHARLARRTRRDLEALAQERAEREEERTALVRFRQVSSAFASLSTLAPRARRTFHLLLPGGDDEAEVRLREGLEAELGGDFMLHEMRLPSGELAVALEVPGAAAERVEALLPERGIRELEIPERYGAASLREAMPAMEARLAQIETELADLEAKRRRLAFERGPELQRARLGLQDRLLAIEALRSAAETPHAFVLEGWLPAPALPRVEQRLAEQEGELVVVEPLGSEEWSAEDAPVVLTNPRLFRPFEMLTRQVPLPHYGSIDPTPFLGVFFPMFFGLILGDMGYGAILGAGALLVRARAVPGSVLKPLAEIAGACAVFSIVFGLLFGEFFGDLGRRWLGLRPLAFSREDAIVPFLALAIAIGFVHVLLGFILGAVASLRSDPRRSVGRGLGAIMTLLVAAALLAALNVLPSAFFTPVVVALLVVFPILVVIEGVIAPIEFLATISNVLSYARIMALGTASVMLAVVANQFVGAFGGAVVGVLFALLFHLVNFVLGVFSPTIQALRLHYVEFFGKFYSPGGVEYRPFRHWRPGEATSV